MRRALTTALMSASMFTSAESTCAILTLVLFLGGVCDLSRRGIGARRSSRDIGCHGTVLPQALRRPKLSSTAVNKDH